MVHYRLDCQLVIIAVSHVIQVPSFKMFKHKLPCLLINLGVKIYKVAKRRNFSKRKQFFKAGLPLTFKFWKSRLPGCQFWKSRKKNLEVWYFEG